MAYEAIEAMISTLAPLPGSPIVESDISERTGIGRTPVREALMRLMSIGLIAQQPRRGLLVTPIDLAVSTTDVIPTRRVLERVIAARSARRATAAERGEIVACADRMVAAAARGDLKGICGLTTSWTWSTTRLPKTPRRCARCVLPVTQCRRF